MTFEDAQRTDFEERMGRSRPWIEYPDPRPGVPFAGQHTGTLLAMMCWGEARGEGYLGMVLVAQVAVVRWLDSKGRFHFGHRRRVQPTPLSAVLLQPKAFSCFNADDPNSARLVKAPKIDARGWDQAKAAAFDVLRERIRTDLVGGATHYHATTMAKPPKWASSPKMVPTVTYMRHAFYREE